MENGEKVSGPPPITFVQTRGSQLFGRHKDKRERIHETMCDLQLAIDGAIAQLGRSERGEQFQQTWATFARACSIFLRKMVIGDKKEKPQTRLLDDEICRSLELTFDRLRKIPPRRRTLDIFTLEVSRGGMRITKKNDITLQPEAVYNIPLTPLHCKISTEWPLPGTASWNDNPTQEKPWQVSPEQLFDTNSSDALDCDAWLGQQLVMFDDKGIALKEVIRTIANYEGAHALYAARLMRTEDERDSELSKNPEVHILNNVKIMGIKYTHIIVMECAIYLYDKLIDNDKISKPKGEKIIPTPCMLNESPEDIFSSVRKFLSYDGGHALSFGGRETLISHRIRAVS